MEPNGDDDHDLRQLRDDDGECAALHDLGGDGPPLLLTHGNGLNAGMWATVVPHLQGTFHCYGLDFRGHGASRQAHERIPVERQWFVAEVLAAVEAIGGAPAFAAGHSLGGATLVRTEQHHPGTLRAAWVFEPVLVPATWDAKPPPSGLIEASRRRRLVFASVDEAVERFRSKPPFATCEPEAVQRYVEIGTAPQPDGTVKLTCTGETEASIYESNEQLDFTRFADDHVPDHGGRRCGDGDGQRVAADGRPARRRGVGQRTPGDPPGRHPLRSDGGRRARRRLDIDQRPPVQSSLTSALTFFGTHIRQPSRISSRISSMSIRSSSTCIQL